MNGLIFTTFNKDGNPVDELISIFDNHNWPVAEIYSEFHKYHWPDITLSEKKRTIEKSYDDGFLNEKEYWGDMDLLGEYIPEKRQIILYILTIEKAAKKLYETIGARLDVAIDILTNIVLVHEISHWIVHTFYPHTKRKRADRIRYSKKEEIYFHEGLAQYFTWIIIENVKGYLDVFKELNRHQSKPYHEFKTFWKKDIDDIIAALAICKLKNIQNIDRFKDETVICRAFNGNSEKKYLSRNNYAPISDEKLKELLKSKIDYSLYSDHLTEHQKSENRGMIKGIQFGV
jgi:hypothetical protein